jgi:hypothetical protein
MMPPVVPEKIGRSRWIKNGSVLSVLLALALSWGLVCPESGSAESLRDSARWLPSFAFQTGLLGTNSHAGVDSTERSYQEGDDRLVVPFVAPRLELASPSLSSVPGRPRIFAHGAVEFDFDLDHAVAIEGDPGAVTIFFVDPDGPGGPAPPAFPSEGAVAGIGSATKATAQTVAFAAGLGLSFDFSIRDRRFQIKPSIEYRYDEFEVSSLMSDAKSISGNGVCPCGIVQLSASETQGFHAIGPGIELEVDVQRRGPFMFSVFTSVQGYYILGDRDMLVQAPGFFDTGAPASVTSTFRRSPWTVRGGVGVRVHWSPE